MQSFFSKTRKASASLKAAAVITLSAASLMAASPCAFADTRGDLHLKNKGSLVSVYRKWSASRNQAQKAVKIQPTAAHPEHARTAAAKTAKNAASSDITDAEILAQSRAEANDPLEPLNRLVFGFNEILDQVIFTPVSLTYRTIVPGPVRTGVSNAVANAKAPVTFANDLLQGEPERAKVTFMRFLINSTAGMGGFVDAAQAGGFEKHTEDFGQTLAVWGVESGPYLVAPVFGPTTPRHLVGRAVDTAATPTTWILADLSLLERTTPTMAELVTGHESILDDITNLRKTSPDFYASVRDIYRQSRKDAILNGELGVDPIPDLPLE